VRDSGEKSVLGLAVGASDTEAHWLEFFRSLARRGLSGVQLVAAARCRRPATPPCARSPWRLAASRDRHPVLGPSADLRGTLLVAVAGVGGIPGSGPVLIGQSHRVSGSQSTYLTVYPAGVSPKPNASYLNVHPGIALPTLVVGLASGAHSGDVNLFNAMGGINTGARRRRLVPMTAFGSPSDANADANRESESVRT
jgi:hypothetical protein